MLAVVVAVLYFDNNTGQPDYDVLSRGLVDMVVTDLAGTPNLTVVERTKLNAVLAELETQRTAFFDPKTARRLGRGLGATHVLTGAISSVRPRIRIDLRLIDVQTAKVKLARKVVGDPKRFFELEASLVASLLEGLGLESRRARAGPKDLDTALDYAKALAAADAGDYRSAAAKMGELLQADPDFLLARVRYAGYAERLRAAKGQRTKALGRIRTDLEASMQERVAKYRHARRRGNLDFNLCGRAVLANLALADLRTLLLSITLEEPTAGQIALAPLRQREKVTALHEAYWNQLDEMYRFVEPRIDVLAKTNGTVDCFIGREDKERLAALDVPAPKRLDFSADAIRRARAGYLIFGRPPAFTGFTFTLWPSLAQADPKMEKRAFAYVESLGGTYVDVDLKARAMLLFGRRQEGIETWQRYLEKNPTAREYPQVELMIERALGLDAKARAFRAALATCDAALVDRMRAETVRRAWANGTKVLPGFVLSVKKACKKRDDIVRSAYFWSARESVFFGDCKMYERMVRERPDLGAGHPEVTVAMEDSCR